MGSAAFSRRDDWGAVLLGVAVINSRAEKGEEHHPASEKFELL
jgi:hypothetical protein